MKAAFTAMLDYLARGWTPVPLHAAPDGVCTCPRGEACSSAGKHPREAWGDGRRVDELQVRAWAQRWRLAANVGVDCGASGLYVVDLDGPEAVATWRAWLEHHGRAPTLTSRTRRGYHVWYRQPPAGEPLANSARKLGPGIDTRGVGGLVVAPPSVHASGHAYAWCAGPVEPAPCPPWLEAVARTAPAPASPPERPAAPALPIGDSRQRAYLFRALEGELQRVLDATEGGRNSTLNRAAYSLGQLVGAGLIDEDALTSALLEAAAAVGLDEAEAVPTIRSGLRAGAQHPRSLVS